MIQLGCLQRDGVDVWVLLRDFQLQTFTVHELADNLKVFASNSGLQIYASCANVNVELAPPWRSVPAAFLVSSELWQSGPSFQRP